MGSNFSVILACPIQIAPHARKLLSTVDHSSGGNLQLLLLLLIRQSCSSSLTYTSILEDANNIPSGLQSQTARWGGFWRVWCFWLGPHGYPPLELSNLTSTILVSWLMPSHEQLLIQMGRLASIKSAASTIAYGLMSYYNGNTTGTVGFFPVILSPLSELGW